MGRSGAAARAIQPRSFPHFEIELPVDALSPGKVWLIVKRGWTIWTRFDVEPEHGSRKHLDCYSMHRMTSDSHVRWFADGEAETTARHRGELRLSRGRHQGGEGGGPGRGSSRTTGGPSRSCSRRRASS